jgi:hypothetical protein
MGGSLEDLVCQIAELQALQATWLIARNRYLVRDHQLVVFVNVTIRLQFKKSVIGRLQCKEIGQMAYT